MRLRWRVVLTGIATAMVGVVVASLLVRYFTQRLMTSGTGPELPWLLDRAERARCEAAPDAWMLEGPRGIPIFAYDATGVSRNPRAPVLGDEMRAALGHDDMALEVRRARDGGAIGARIASGGPCAILAAEWPPVFSPPLVIGFVVLCLVGAAAAGAIVSYAALVRPLVRRLATVRRAASSVGVAEGYASVDAGTRDDLGVLAHELDRAHERIRADAAELERRRVELHDQIADVAHDLRTPLASLQLALQEAALGDRDALVRAIGDVVYVGGLVSNLRLAAALRESHETRAVSVSLGETVERAALRVGFLARQKRVALDVAVPEQPIRALGDPIAIEQAIANVVENAVAHNLPDRHVAVLAEAGDATFTITVVDDGPGVEPDELPRLGERTFRSDAARQRDDRGRGLGLAITAEVCRRHGFELRFAREDPMGLRVTIVGPVAKA